MCPRNGSGPGTTLRVCQDCSSILEVWHRLGIIWTPAPEVEDTPIRWISQLFANNERQVQLSIIIIWDIWTSSRNKIIHEGIFQTTPTIVISVLGYMRELESLSLNRAGVVAPGPLL